MSKVSPEGLQADMKCPLHQKDAENINFDSVLPTVTVGLQSFMADKKAFNRFSGLFQSAGSVGSAVLWG